MRRNKIKFTGLDGVILAALAAAFAYLAYRVTIGMHYKWEWGVIPQYLFRYDAAADAWKPNVFIEGLFTTIRLSFWATLLAAILGTVMGVFRVSRSLFKRMVSRTYVETVRNLPPLVLVFLFFFFFSDQIMPAVRLDDFIRSQSASVQNVLALLFAPAERFAAFISAVITLALYEGAYITEIVRAGIESVEKGQWEASYALGLSWWRQMRFVIMPQAFQRALPPLAGQFISAIKDSAIVSIISIQELTFQGVQLMAATYLTFEIWITIVVLYLALTLTCSLGARWLEIRLSRKSA